MAKPFHNWTVLPHGRVRHLEDNLITVAGVLHMAPVGDVVRRMTIARLDDGRLVIYSAIALDEAEMHDLETFGEPAFLIVPSAIHRMDIRIWRDRYPGIEIVAPAGARKKVEQIVPVHATEVVFGDPRVRYFTLRGTGEREAGLLVESEGGATLVLNDIIFNMVNRRGLSGWLFKAIGITGDEPHIPPLIRMRLVRDSHALGAQIEDWSHLPNLKRVIVAHGGIIMDRPAEVLGHIARDLAA